MSLITQTLQTVAQKWAEYRKVTIEIKATGPITRQAVACYKNRLASDFRNLLADEPPRDGKIIREFKLGAGKTFFRLKICPGDMITVNRSIDSSADRPKSILETIQDHISEKRDQCEKNHCLGFMLIYVRPPMCGTADMNPSAFQESFSLLLNQETAKTDRISWLGAAMIDWAASRSGKAKIHLITNNKANWPNGLTKEDIASLECL